MERVRRRQWFSKGDACTVGVEGVLILRVDAAVLILDALRLIDNEVPAQPEGSGGVVADDDGGIGNDGVILGVGW